MLGRQLPARVLSLGLTMGLRSFVKKVGRGLKKALPYVAMAAPFIPGVGPAIGGAISKVGNLLGTSSAQSNSSGFMGPPDPANPTEGQQVNVSGGGGYNWGKALGDAAPSIISGGLNYLGQRQTNVANAQQAQAQMDFQNQQTSTSYQRGVEDMKKAGLNPMLAYSQGGAASGSGASAVMGNELGAGANSAQSAMLARQQIQQSAAQINNINADTSNKEQQTTNLESENLYTLAKTSSEGTRNHELAQRVAQIALQNQLDSATQASNISSARSAADLRGHQATGEKYSLSEKGAWSKFYDSWAGQKYPYVSKATEQSNSAANVFRKFIPFTND